MLHKIKVFADLCLSVFSLQSKGCVWTEAELWDVWTDFDCNDGRLLKDR